MKINFLHKGRTNVKSHLFDLFFLYRNKLFHYQMDFKMKFSYNRFNTKQIDSKFFVAKRLVYVNFQN